MPNKNMLNILSITSLVNSMNNNKQIIRNKHDDYGAVVVRYC